jgi:hypothetical protein
MDVGESMERGLYETLFKVLVNRGDDISRDPIYRVPRSATTYLTHESSISQKSAIFFLQPPHRYPNNPSNSCLGSRIISSGTAF